MLGDLEIDRKSLYYWKVLKGPRYSVISEVINAPLAQFSWFGLVTSPPCQDQYSPEYGVVGLVGDYPYANPGLVPGDGEHMCCHLIDSDNTLANTSVTIFVRGAVKQDLRKKLVFWTNQGGL